MSTNEKGWLGRLGDQFSSWGYNLGIMSAKCDTSSCTSLSSMRKTYQACTSPAKDRLPHRNHRGTFAARFIGHEIRHVTQMVTGKDLAELRNNPSRKRIFNTIENIKTVVNRTKYNFTDFSVDFGRGLIKSFALESSSAEFSEGNIYSNIVKLKPQDVDIQKSDSITSSSNIQSLPNEVVENESLQGLPSELHELKKSEDISSTNFHMDSKAERPCTCSSLRQAAEEWLKANKVNFCWQHRGIPDDEFDEYWSENKSSFQSSIWQPSTLSTYEKGWQKCFDADKYSVWRKPLDGTSTYSYRVQAQFKDVKPKHMYRVQTDCELRKEWDNYVQKLEVIDAEPRSNSELIHWITDCPYPMTAREYLYKRRTKIDEQNRTMMVFSELERDVPLPETPAFRVNRYASKLLLKSHEESFDEAGTDMILMYYDDPESRAPSYVLNKAATYGISMMMDNIHKTAKRLEREENEE